MKPLYKHDCTDCTFLGTVTINGVNGDVYCCKEQDNNPRYTEIVVRFSDEPSDYTCAMPCVFGPLSPFTAVAISLWAKHKGCNGWNNNGTLIKDGEVFCKIF